MAQYQIATTQPNSIVDHQIYSKSGKVVDYTETYRSGWASFNTDDNEDFDSELFDAANPDGFDVGELLLDDHDYSGSAGNDIQFSASVTPQEKQQFMAIFEQGGIEALGAELSKAGWMDDYSTMFLGPLTITSDDDELLERILQLAQVR